MIPHMLGFQAIKNIRPAVHSTGLQRASLFGEVEQGNVSKRNIIKIEIAAEIHPAFEPARKQTTEFAPARQRPRKPSKVAQVSKWRVLRVIHEITPVSVFLRPTTRKN